MNEKINVLVLEDSPDYSRLLQEIFSEVGTTKIEFTETDCLDQALQCVRKQSFDVILLDLAVPDSQGIGTFGKMHAEASETPIVVLTGLDDEATALNAVHQGAQDYLVKGEISGGLLIRSLKYAIERKRAEKEKEKLYRELEKAHTQLNILHGLLPICSSCKSIRDDEGYWHDVEGYIESHSVAEFTHGVCPVCLKKALPLIHEKPRHKNSSLQ